MKTIQITAAVATSIQAIRDSGKTPWVIATSEYVVGVYKGRTEAREDKAAHGFQGSICKADELNLEVVELVAEVPAPKVAPIGGEIEGNVHDYICPHCGIDLENGVGEHLQDVNGKQIRHDKYEFACLACGGEFGAEIEKVSKAAKTGRKIKITNESTIERPCKRVWVIADEMHAANPNCKRREVLAECVNQGIAYYTARTQYQQWLGIQKEMAERIAMQAAKK